MKNLYFAVILILALILPVFQPMPVQATTAILSVTGEGSTYGAFPGTYSGGATNYTNMNSDDGDTSYLSILGVSSYRTWTFTPFSTSTIINSVTLYAKVRSDYPGFRHVCKIGSTIYSGSNVTDNSSYTLYSYTWDLNPATSAAWTIDSLNAASFGLYQYGNGPAYATYVYMNVDYTSVVITPPAITTMAATNISASAAQLNSIVDTDGNQYCDVRFAYDNVTRANFGDYANTTAWVSNTYLTGNYPYANIAGLSSGATYYFRAQIANDNSTVTGSELNFTTPSGVINPTNASAIPKSTTISLAWTKGSGSTHTLARYSTSAYPTTTSTGTSAYMGTGNSVNISSLLPGTTYFISLWGYTGGLYSDNYTTTLATTLAYDSASSTVNDIEVPTTTVTGIASTTKVEGLPWAQAFTDISTASDMPVASIWYLFWFMFGVGLGIILYNRMPGQYNLNVTVAAEALWFGLGVTMGLLYLLIPFILILIALGFIIFGGRH